MPYCPNCGKEIMVGDHFCLNCGQSLERLYSRAEPSPEVIPELAPPVPAMNTSSLYLLGERGLLKVGTAFSLVAVPIVLGAVLGLFVVVYTGFGNWVAMSVVIALIIGPMVGEYRARRLARVVGFGDQELASRPGVRTIPWSSIESMRLKGRKLSFKSDRGWVSTTLDGPDATRLARRAPAILAERFTLATEEPPRFSPMAKFFLLTATIFVLSEAITVGASLAPFFSGEQQHYTDLYNSVEKGLGPTVYQQLEQIFLNNVQVALAGFVPGFGSLVLGLSSYNTGRVIQAIAVLNNVPPSGVLLVLFVLPHSWVEELSYPLAGALGYYALTWRSQSYAEFSNWKTRASTKVTFGFVSVALVLAIAAALEVSEPGLGIDGALLLWVPVVVIGAYAFRKLRRRLAAALS